MACTKETVKASGLNIWSDEAVGGPAPVVDIIAVQGLGSHEFYTWVKRVPSAADRPKKFRDKARFWKGKKPLDKGVEDGTTEVMWIRDLLVPKFKDARIATYSYKSDWRDRAVKTSLRQCAEQLLNILSQHRQQAEERRRPLVLIGHSLGGLVIQQALVIAIHQLAFTDLRLSVAGVIFLGAPFQGSDVASVGTWLARISGLDSAILKLLEKDSPSLFALSRDFWGSYNDWDLVCFYEKIDAEYGPIKKQMVSSQSASLLGKRMIFLDANHSGLSKFSGEDDENFRLVLPEIRRMVEGSGLIVTEHHRANDSSGTLPGNVHWKVPRTVNSLFTGRTKLLLRIQTVLRGDTTSLEKQRRFVITGLGGQGKSEICLQVANLLKDDFWGIFWVDVDKPSTAERDFVAVAKNFGSSAESVPDALHVLATTQRSWLLVLDNADDPEFDYQAYFPPGNHGAVLMTSRVAECMWYSPDAFDALDGLEEDDSKALLFKAAGFAPDSWPSYDDQAKEVVRLLGSHTLALIQAGAYISQGHCQLHQYPAVYRRQRKRLLKYRPKQAQSRYHDVYATFEASADVLEQSRSESAGDALRLLEILSMLDSGVLSLQFFEEAWKGCKDILRTNRVEARDIGEFSQRHVVQLPSFMVTKDDEWDPFRLTEATSLLISLSLVTRHNSDGYLGLSMHPLTHAWAKDRQDLERQGVAWIVTGCILGFSYTNTRMWQMQERRLLAHILSYLDIETKTAFGFASDVVVTPIFLKCGWALLDMRQDYRLGQLLEDAFLELGQSPGKSSEEFLPLYDLQARSLMNLGMNKNAVALLEQVVKIRETTLAETHPNRLASQHVLAGAYHANGQVTEAVALLEQVVKIEETTLAETHPNRLASQHELAGAYQANGQVAEAVALLKQVVKIEETTLAETHPSRLVSQHELAIAYQANGQVAEAVALLKQVVKIEETTLAETHPSRLASQHVLAGAYQANGQVAEAVALLKQVVKIRETTLAETHPSRLASQHVLAGAYQANGQVAEAVALLEQVVKIRETTLAETHPSRLASQHELAGAYQANGQVTEAVALLEQVVKIRETTLAETHPNRLASQHVLAGAYHANGQVAEAVALLKQVVKIRETTLAETHPSRLASQHVLAGAYHANGQVAEAVALLEQVVKIHETTLAETHPSRLASQHELAGAYQANGQVAEAVALLEQVVKIEETTLAETHPSRLASQHALAGAYHANGQVAEAVALLEQVVKIKRLKLPMSHPSRLVSENALSYFLLLR